MSDHRDEKGRLRDYILQLINQVQVRLVGVSDAAIRAELFDVMRIFFNDTNFWREDISLTAVANTLDYPIVPSSGKILRLLAVTDQNNMLQAAFMKDVGTVSFLFPYSNTNHLTATVAKTVADPFRNHGIPEFPSIVLENYGQYLLSGLVDRLMKHPDKPYTNPILAAEHRGIFREGIGLARSAADRQNSWGAQNWAYPRNFRTRTQRGGVAVTGFPW